MDSHYGGHDTCSIDKHIGLRLILALRLARMSKLDLAEVLDTDLETTTLYCSGVRRISVAELFRISSAVNKPLQWFYTGLRIESEHCEAEASVHLITPTSRLVL